MKFASGHLLLPAIAILGFVLGIYVAPLFTVTSTTTGVSTVSGLKYTSQVCVSKNGVLLSCSPNLFTTAGKNLIYNYLNNNSLSAQNWVRAIAVCNGTINRADDNYCGYEFTQCGLSRASGTVTTNATAGVWFIEKVFTVSGCTGSVVANSTGLFNSTTNASSIYFAGNNFSAATLQNADQLNITWTIAVT